EIAIHGFQGTRLVRHRCGETLFHLRRNSLPHWPLPDRRQVVHHVIQHAVTQSAYLIPVIWVQSLLTRASDLGRLGLSTSAVRVTTIGSRWHCTFLLNTNQ